jgi:hypothetical protein
MLSLHLHKGARFGYGSRSPFLLTFFLGQTPVHVGIGWQNDVIVFIWLSCIEMDVQWDQTNVFAS